MGNFALFHPLRGAIYEGQPGSVGSDVPCNYSFRVRRNRSERRAWLPFWTQLYLPRLRQRILGYALEVPVLLPNGHTGRRLDRESSHYPRGFDGELDVVLFYSKRILW